MNIFENDLDAFIAESDRLGGPNAQACQDYWKDFTYHPSQQPDQGLDPFSEEYVAQQVALYEELSGHAYDVVRDEITEFEIKDHVEGPNPYNEHDPATMSVHIDRLNFGIRNAAPKSGHTVLDMGCGWGLSSEFFAYLGLKVIAADINKRSIELVNARIAHKNIMDITTVNGTFENVILEKPVEMAFFYECLHHAIRPWVVFSNLKRNLVDDGKIVLAGEPINSFWWKNWGMRLDPISVYCIRKFGWFESGWSLPFLRKALLKAGCVSKVFYHPDPQVGINVVGQFGGYEISGSEVSQIMDNEGCSADEPYLIFGADSKLDLVIPIDCSIAYLHICNFRMSPLQVEITSGAGSIWSGYMQNGENVIPVPCNGEDPRLTIRSQTWSPAQDGMSQDDRTLGVHLAKIRFQ
ncbi:class I SAM-dependent methyltransferase [Sphingobium nicotianae]|uniref:Methyltransferase domain-containing protein n=1 Tax=Sphingobium nicotianae TaxID=2782607 RepID=A0A9X1IRV4_9SPHN|nr:methyltransferase domain-containing protein [Sphingobium nicotianae]MBT2187515.1 methyltransferase domain-containing protein [Sphingobium nicotianae]